MSLADQQWCPTSVQVTVHQARGLRIKGKSGTNDAYALMQVGKEKFQTSVVEKSVAPVWKEEAAFDLPQLLQGGGKGGGGGTERTTLHVHVLHRALVGPDKLLGQAVINLLQLSEDKTRNKTEWFKLLDKTGKADKDRGEVLVDIQFMRNNMTASMFDLSAAGKSKSRMGKFKDKVRGKKKESDATSNLVPSNQVLTDSEEEGNGDGEIAAGKDEKKKKHKMKSLFSTKSNLQRNMSQSMSVLPAKNSSLSGSQSSGLNVDSSEGKKKFKFLIHKRSGSSDSKDSSSAHQKHVAVEQSNVCINGSHVYCEEPQPRTSRVSSNFSLNSSGHGSMEDVPESSPSADSLQVVRQYSPWTEEEEEEAENIKEDVGEEIRLEEKRRRKEEEEERVRRQEGEERRTEEEKVKKEEVERIRREEEERAKEDRRQQETEERIRREKQEHERLAEEKRKRDEQERRIEEEKVRIERIRMEEERAQEERKRQEEERVRRQDEERKLAAQKILEEEERRIEEEKVRIERIRMEEERAEEERRRREEEEMVRRQEEERVEKSRLEEQERRQREEGERIRMEEERAQEERRRREEEERTRRQEEEHKLAEQNRLEEEEREIEEEKVRKEEEGRLRREMEKAEEETRRQEEEMVRRQEEREKKRLEEEERIQRQEEERIRKEEDEKTRREKEECERLVEEERKRIVAEEQIRREEEERIRLEEERKRIVAEEQIRREEEERIRAEEERKRIVAEEKIRLEEERIRAEEERKRIVAEEKIRREEEERIRVEEERKRIVAEEKIRREEEERIRLEEERKKIVAEEEIRREEEERIRVEEERRRKEEEEESVRRQEEERKKLAEEKRIVEEQERRRIEEEERIRKEEKVEKGRREEEARRLEKEEKKKESKTKHRAAGKKPKVAAEMSSTNPFDEDFSNPFDEIPNSPAGPDSSTARGPSVQQRVQSTASSVGSKPISTDEKNPISTQRERRLAPQPPGRNETETQSQREQDGSVQLLAQMNKKSKDKDIKTVSVLPQRSVQMITPLNRYPTDTKNTQSLMQKSSTKETSNAAKHSKRPAPSKPRSVEEEPSSEHKTAPSSKGSEAKRAPIVYGLNPFEDDEEENAPQDDPTASGDTGPVQLPPVASQVPDKDGASQTKIKSSKARAAPLPAKRDATSSTSINPNTEGDHVPDTGVTDNGVTHACDPKAEGRSSVHIQDAPQQESQPVTVQSAEKEGKEGPPVTSRRLHPVKPLNPLEEQSIAVVQGERDNKSTGIISGVQEKTKVNGTGLKGPYSQLTQEELITLVLKQENQLSQRDKKISELEQYIDNLLLRVMEEQPSILMSLNSPKKAA